MQGFRCFFCLIFALLWAFLGTGACSDLGSLSEPTGESSLVTQDSSEKEQHAVEQHPEHDTQEHTSEPNTVTPASLLERRCPSDGKSPLFRGKPCDENAYRSECLQENPYATDPESCVPVLMQREATKGLSDTEFAKECANPEIICVGAKYAYTSLQKALDAFKSTPTIKKILVADGLYTEAASITDIPRELIIEGQSIALPKPNNPQMPQAGSRFVAPAPSTPTSAFATLSLTRVQKVVLRRLLLSGEGHGLLISQAQHVVLDNILFIKNRKSGATIQDLQGLAASLSIKNSRFLYNGASKESDPKKAGQFYQELHWGLVVQGAANITLQGNEIARNGAGGAILQGAGKSEQIGVIVNNDYLVFGDSQVGVIVNNDYHLAGEGNHVHHNGPISAAYGQMQATDTGCSPVCSLCEKNVCFRPLSAAYTPSGSQASLQTWAGVGLLVAGFGKHVQLAGNSFFRNDVAALWIHSSRGVRLSHNVFERNGSREDAHRNQLKATAIPAVKAWQLQGTLEIQSNLLLDNVASGIQVEHPKLSQQAPAALSVTATGNYFGGNGRFFQADDEPIGKGIFLSSDKSSATWIQANISNNHFSDNQMAGMYTWGAVVGQVSHNYFHKHPFRTLVLHNIGLTPEIMLIRNNIIASATAYGIQIYNGSANLQILDNTIRNVQPIVQVNQNEYTKEADAINITGFSGKSARIEIRNNDLTASRAGVLLDSITNQSIELSNNKFGAKLLDVALQNTEKSQLSGNNAQNAKVPTQPLANTPPCQKANERCGIQ